MLDEAVNHKLQAIKNKPIIKSCLEQLQRELPAHLIYHRYAHTEDVLTEAVTFAMIDKIDDRSIELIAIAAAFHDAGFIKSPARNEGIGAAMARKAMTTSGDYSKDEIDIVERMIMDTSLMDTSNGPRQVPTTDLSRYVLDADLSNFGREDFFDKGELFRQELGYDQSIFRIFSFELLHAHRWLTNAARSLRQAKKEENIRLLKEMLPPQQDAPTMSFDRLGFLAKLSLLLNSSLDTKHIIEVAIEELAKRLQAQAATIFLLDDDGATLTFWAMEGSSEGRLAGMKMPADKGIVGWVITHQESVLVQDAENDPRFFSVIDKEAGFKTRNILCSPLTVAGKRKLGAVQVLNKIEGSFDRQDLQFLDQFGNQIALAIDHARLLEAVRERNKKLELLDLRKNEMMSVIAHEFRTPLNLIGTSAEILASGKTLNEDTVDKMLSILGNGVRRLTKLISEVKNLSLSTAGKLDVNLGRVQIEPLFKQVLEHFGYAISARHQTFNCNLPPKISVVKADEALLLLVLKNLVSNAIRFTPDNGTITLAAVERAGLITISVQDTGIGIEKDQLSLIFEKFYEVGSAMQHSSGEYEFKSGGLGLGLATAKAVLVAHSSSIDVQSTLGKGSTFSFALPVFA